MKVWSPAELATFLAAIEGNRNEALFRLLALTGMRRSEVVGLRWSDVDLDRHRLTVNQAATVVDGEEHIDTPKSRRSRRVIDLDADTVVAAAATPHATASSCTSASASRRRRATGSSRTRSATRSAPTRSARRSRDS